MKGLFRTTDVSWPGDAEQARQCLVDYGFYVCANKDWFPFFGKWNVIACDDTGDYNELGFVFGSGRTMVRALVSVMEKLPVENDPRWDYTISWLKWGINGKRTVFEKPEGGTEGR